MEALETQDPTDDIPLSATLMLQAIQDDIIISKPRYPLKIGTITKASVRGQALMLLEMQEQQQFLTGLNLMVELGYYTEPD